MKLFTPELNKVYDSISFTRTTEEMGGITNYIKVTYEKLVFLEVINEERSSYVIQFESEACLKHNKKGETLTITKPLPPDNIRNIYLNYWELSSN
jgi:hypothetical protein